MLDRRRVVFAIAAEVGADLRTVERWLDRGKVHPVTDWALTRAAEMLLLGSEVNDIRPGTCLPSSEQTTAA